MFAREPAFVGDRSDDVSGLHAIFPADLDAVSIFAGFRRPELSVRSAFCTGAWSCTRVRSLCEASLTVSVALFVGIKLAVRFKLVVGLKLALREIFHEERSAFLSDLRQSGRDRHHRHAGFFGKLRDHFLKHRQVLAGRHLGDALCKPL